MASNITTVSIAVPLTAGILAEPVKTTPSDAIADYLEEEAITETKTEKCVEKSQLSEPKSFGFYAIILALCLTGLLTSLEATVTSTALPTITAVLGGGDLFIWVINGYYLTMLVQIQTTLRLPDILCSSNGYHKGLHFSHCSDK